MSKVSVFTQVPVPVHILGNKKYFLWINWENEYHIHIIHFFLFSTTENVPTYYGRKVCANIIITYGIHLSGGSNPIKTGQIMIQNKVWGLLLLNTHHFCWFFRAVDSLSYFADPPVFLNANPAPAKKTAVRLFKLAEVLKNQCCGSGMIYSGSWSSIEFSEFRIQAKVPDPDPTYLN